MSKPKFTGDVLPHETMIEVIRTNSYGEVIKKRNDFWRMEKFKEAIRLHLHCLPTKI